MAPDDKSLGAIAAGLWSTVISTPNNDSQFLVYDGTDSFARWKPYDEIEVDTKSDEEHALEKIKRITDDAYDHERCEARIAGILQEVSHIGEYEWKTRDGRVEQFQYLPQSHIQNIQTFSKSRMQLARGEIEALAEQTVRFTDDKALGYSDALDMVSGRYQAHYINSELTRMEIYRRELLPMTSLQKRLVDRATARMKKD